MSNAQQIADFARQQLKSILHRSGRVLYSSAATLSPGTVYLLGLNPGGDPANPVFGTISDSLTQLPTRTENAFLDEAWLDKNGTPKQTIQPRTVYLLFRQTTW